MVKISKKKGGNYFKKIRTFTKKVLNNRSERLGKQQCIKNYKNRTLLRPVKLLNKANPTVIITGLYKNNIAEFRFDNDKIIIKKIEYRNKNQSNITDDLDCEEEVTPREYNKLSNFITLTIKYNQIVENGIVWKREKRNMIEKIKKLSIFKYNISDCDIYTLNTKLSNEKINATFFIQRIDKESRDNFIRYCCLRLATYNNQYYFNKLNIGNLFSDNSNYNNTDEYESSVEDLNNLASDFSKISRTRLRTQLKSQKRKTKSSSSKTKILNPLQTRKVRVKSTERKRGFKKRTSIVQPQIVISRTKGLGKRKTKKPQLSQNLRSILDPRVGAKQPKSILKRREPYPINPNYKLQSNSSNNSNNESSNSNNSQSCELRGKCKICRKNVTTKNNRSKDQYGRYYHTKCHKQKSK